MAERTTAPAPQASAIPVLHEVRVLADLVKSLGVDMCIADETGEPFFSFTERTLAEVGVLAEHITGRFRADPKFKAAMRRVVESRGNNLPVGGQLLTEAEHRIGELEELGFLTSVLHNGGQPTRLDVAFERYGPLVAEAETLQLMDRIHERFRNDAQFANDLVDYCVSAGSYYDERR